MKQKWSGKWASSTQPRKQRKFRTMAPLHIKRKFVSAHLSSPLRKYIGRRAVPLRKGDEVRIMRGKFKKKTGAVERIDLKSSKIYIQDMKVKKVDGSEVMIPFTASNLMITKLELDDKRRKAAIEIKKRKSATKPEVKTIKKGATEEIKEVKTEVKEMVAKEIKK